MSLPIRRIQYFFWSIQLEKSNNSFELFLKNCHQFAIATCGEDNQTFAFESSEDCLICYETAEISQTIENYIEQLSSKSKFSKKAHRLLIDTFNDKNQDEFCKADKNNFIADPEEPISLYSPCIFTLSDVAPEFEGAFINTEFFEIHYEADKLLSLYDLHGRLNQQRGIVYGVSI